MNADHKKKMIELIRTCCAITEETIEAETKLSEISLDSLSYIQLIVSLEEEFGIVFEDEELNINESERVQNLIDLVEEKRSETKRKNIKEIKRDKTI